MRVRTSKNEENKSKYAASSNKLQKTNKKGAGKKCTEKHATAHPTDKKPGETQTPLNVNKNQVKRIRTGRQSQWREKHKRRTWGTETIPNRKHKPENLNHNKQHRNWNYVKHGSKQWQLWGEYREVRENSGSVWGWKKKIHTFSALCTFCLILL